MHQCQLSIKLNPYLELMQILYFANEVVLKVQDLELGTQLSKELYLFNILLMQRHLLQR